jgi:hypothetical protein
MTKLTFSEKVFLWFLAMVLGLTMLAGFILVVEGAEMDIKAAAPAVVLDAESTPLLVMSAKIEQMVSAGWTIIPKDCKTEQCFVAAYKPAANRDGSQNQYTLIVHTLKTLTHNKTSAVVSPADFKNANQQGIEIWKRLMKIEDVEAVVVRPRKVEIQRYFLSKSWHPMEQAIESVFVKVLK